MKLAKEPIEVDFIIKSEPWSEKDLADFSILIQEIKHKNKRKKNTSTTKSTNQTKSEKTQTHF